jgi:preprotein translocase subunit SecE
VAKKSAPGKKASTKNDYSVVRIKASSSAPKREKKVPVAAEIATSAAPAKKPKAKQTKKEGRNVLTAIGGYFKGAWVELRQVRWPTRRATWSLTGAVLIYTAFFVILVLLLDAGFKYLFELILGK